MTAYVYAIGWWEDTDGTQVEQGWGAGCRECGWQVEWDTEKDNLDGDTCFDYAHIARLHHTCLDGAA